MERLGGLDAAFLALETPTMYMHMAAVLVLEPPDHLGGEPPAVVAERIGAVIEERLHLVPLLRRRAVRVPFGLHHPVWIDDPSFDLDYHVQRARLPAPGGPAELAGLVSSIVGRPLDASRPLWEMHVVEGLDSGHVAVIPKIHHAAIDGVSGAETLAAFLDLGPEGRSVPPPLRPWRPEPVPSDVELLGWSLTSLTGEVDHAVGAARRTVGALVDLARRNRRLREEDEQRPPPAPFRAPMTSLNGAISSQRRTAFAEMPLEDVRTVRQAFGGTVNDVVLATVSGALRRLLAERGERPGEPLVALVPISTRSEADHGSQGNRLSAMLVSLASTVADPVERLRVVAEGARLAKDQARVLAEDVIRGWAQLAFPALSSRLARLSGNLRLFDHVPPLFNVVVSNIPGPDFPLWWAGSRVVALYPLGPIMEGVGLNVTVLSYMGTLYVGAVGCRELVPEVDHFAHLLTESAGELVKAAVRHGGHWA
ncbi:MAG TPA: wax ester/triacylglycerol synthase family O-acyltransferase [Acidimicrobiales bacterium]|nr:wax ester/triacylglycerol synthase family O-acyltransferase [Acidimicrobiales bacterium]